LKLQVKRGIWVRYAAYVYSIGRGELMCTSKPVFTPKQNSRHIYRLQVIFVVHNFISTAKFHIKNFRSIISKKFIGTTLPHLYFFGGAEEFRKLHTKLHFLALQKCWVFIHILGTLAKLRKATVNFYVSVRPSIHSPLCISVRMQQLGFHWMDIHEIWFSKNFRNLSKIFKFL
jgi:hypothetical protein